MENVSNFFTIVTLSAFILISGKKNSDPAGSPLLLLPPLQPNSLIDVANTKLKLQLFPVDDGTRRALELVRPVKIASINLYVKHFDTNTMFEVLFCSG